MEKGPRIMSGEVLFKAVLNMVLVDGARDEIGVTLENSDMVNNPPSKVAYIPDVDWVVDRPDAPTEALLIARALLTDHKSLDAVAFDSAHEEGCFWVGWWS